MQRWSQLNDTRQIFPVLDIPFHYVYHACRSLVSLSLYGPAGIAENLPPSDILRLFRTCRSKHSADNKDDRRLLERSKVPLVPASQAYAKVERRVQSGKILRQV